uniref:Uncharacterized protein n=1 Tax=Romanomermis culicivorax TaxID=13658 RepID=A0A915L099_ROMCU
MLLSDQEDDHEPAALVNDQQTKLEEEKLQITPEKMTEKLNIDEEDRKIATEKGSPDEYNGHFSLCPSIQVMKTNIEIPHSKARFVEKIVAEIPHSWQGEKVKSFSSNYYVCATSKTNCHAVMAAMSVAVP